MKINSTLVKSDGLYGMVMPEKKSICKTFSGHSCTWSGKECACSWETKVYDSALKSSKDAAIRYEDQEHATQFIMFIKDGIVKPGVYHLPEPLEVEQTEQYRFKAGHLLNASKWMDYKTGETVDARCEWQTVLRISQGTEPSKFPELSMELSPDAKAYLKVQEENMSMNVGRMQMPKSLVGVEEKKEPETYKVTVDDIINFATWYSGMERSKVERQYKRYLREVGVSEREEPTHLTEKEYFALIGASPHNAVARTIWDTFKAHNLVIQKLKS